MGALASADDTCFAPGAMGVGSAALTFGSAAALTLTKLELGCVTFFTGAAPAGLARVAFFAGPTAGPADDTAAFFGVAVVVEAVDLVLVFFLVAGDLEGVVAA